MRKQNIITIVTLMILLIVSIVFLNIDKQHRIDKYIQKTHKDFNIQFNTIYNEKKQISQMIYNDIISDTRILNILSTLQTTKSIKYHAILRKKLYDLVVERYAQWKLLGIQQLHFHTPKNISFLRMHKVNKFGDDLTNIRESIKIVNKNKIASEGFEMGKIKSGFRFVFPILSNEGVHLGSLEASISTEQFKKEIVQAFHNKAKFIIKKELIDKKAFKKSIEKFYKQSDISKNFYTHKHHISKASIIPKDKIKEINDKFKTNNIFSVYFQKDHKFTIITFFPIRNIKDKQTVAYFVTISNANYIKNLYNDFYIILSMIIALFLAVIIYIYNNNRYKNTLNKNLELIHKQKEELSHSIYELEQQNIQIANQMEENRKKDTLIAEQSRLASLGEMIGNIAHQWRQPLSAISTSASSMTLQNELGLLDCKKELNPALTKIIEKTQFLSQTIEDFRHFIEGKKESVDFIISSAVDNALNVIDSSIARHHLSIIKNYESIIEITSYKNEFIQAILNIINNAKDALAENVENVEERYIFINIKKDSNSAILTIQDNAGGIPEHIKEKVFEPYFTTKHQSQGTGLGLYMTYKIIKESMQGDIIINNENIIYNNKTYYGAKFIITLPLVLEEKEENV